MSANGVRPITITAPVITAPGTVTVGAGLQLIGGRTLGASAARRRDRHRPEQRSVARPRRPDAATAGTASFTDVANGHDQRPYHVQALENIDRHGEHHRLGAGLRQRLAQRQLVRPSASRSPASIDTTTRCRPTTSTGTCRSACRAPSNTASRGAERPRRRSAVRRHAVPRAGADADCAAADRMSRPRPARA